MTIELIVRGEDSKILYEELVVGVEDREIKEFRELVKELVKVAKSKVKGAGSNV
jgi:hypothetical protein